MAKIILTVGPPGCGKTLWAKLYLITHKAKILNRDDMRLMMQNGNYNKADEKVIKRIRDYSIESWLQHGYDVIVDDLNLTSDIFPKMVEIANRVGDVSVEEHILRIDHNVCWYNNEHRLRGKIVPQTDWAMWWLKYVNFKKHDTHYAPPKQVAMQMFYDEYKISKLPRAIILDLDNTIAMHPPDRDPYNHEHIPDDIPNKPLIDMLGIVGAKILIVTGRGEKGKEATKKWLHEHEIGYDALFMRPFDKPDEKDYIIKKEIYENEIKEKYFVTGVFDDREQAVSGWRALGLPVYQVDFGRF